MPKGEPPKRKRPPLIFLVLAAAAVAALVLVIIVGQLASGPPAVRLAEATVKTSWADAVVLIATGHVEPEKKLMAAALSPGRIKALHVEAGKTVTVGQVIAELDPAVMEANVAEAKAASTAAKAKVKAAKRKLSLERARAKKDKASGGEGQRGAVSAAAAAVAAANAEVSAAEARMKSAKLGLQNTKVTAPMTGTVYKVHAAVGGPVPDNLAIAELADMSKIYVDADVAEGKLGVTQAGMAADVTLDAFAGRRFDAVVVRVVPEIDKNTGTGTVRLHLPQPSPEVLLNMAARVSFLRQPIDLKTRSEPAKTVVPKAAVTTRDGAPTLFVFRQGVVSAVAVSQGIELGSDIAISAGAKPGDRVVLDPPADLKDGERVELLP